jgi:hypothetical protein
MNADKRVHPRVPMSQTASVTNQGQTRQAILGNLSLGGAFVTGIDLPVGSGVRIAFRLSTGLPVTLNGKVVRAGSGSGIQFFQIDDVTREILDDYLKSAEAATSKISAEIAVKYQLNRGGGRVTLKLSGYLETADCTRVREIVVAELVKVGKREILLVIDASLFSCCSPEGLKEFRSLLEAIKMGHNVVGALVGQRTVGVLQLRRAVREGGMADGFMGFETPAEADEVLGQLER